MYKRDEKFSFFAELGVRGTPKFFQILKFRLRGGRRSRGSGPILQLRPSASTAGAAASPESKFQNL